MRVSHRRFQLIGSSRVAIHPDPVGVIQFIGGAFFATSPIIFYYDLLQNLFEAGYTVITLRYWLTLNHWSTAQQLFENQQRLPVALELEAEKLGYNSDIYKNSSNYFWIGHSLGCEYITLLRFLSLKKQEQTSISQECHQKFDCNLNATLAQPASNNLEEIENFPSAVAFKVQPALLVAPCFQAPALIRPYVHPQQNLKRCLLANTSQIAPLAMISFDQDRLAGSLRHQFGDVYWIERHLKNNRGKGLIISQEISGDHYRPLQRKAEERELVELIDYFLEVLKIGRGNTKAQKHELEACQVYRK